MPARTYGDQYVPKRAADVIVRKNGDGSVSIMRLEDDKYYYSLDAIAAELWLLIDSRRSLGEIKAKLIRQHRPPLKRFEGDVQRLLGQLLQRKLLER